MSPVLCLTLSVDIRNKLFLNAGTKESEIFFPSAYRPSGYRFDYFPSGGFVEDLLVIGYPIMSPRVGGRRLDWRVDPPAP